MTETKRTSPTRGKLLTTGRFAATALAAALVGIAGSACVSTDTANETANATNSNVAKKPSVTITQQRPAQPAQLDQLSPEVLNTEVVDLDGKPFKLADYKDKIVVLDLWASWCIPCRKEVPHLVELNKEYGSKGVEVVGLTTENPERDGKAVRDFAKEFKINYRVGWSPRDLSLALMRGNQSIPQTFVIAPGGRVVAHYRGYNDALPTMIRSSIDKARDVAGD